jgi:hypothetical protein
MRRKNKNLVLSPSSLNPTALKYQLWLPHFAGPKSRTHFLILNLCNLRNLWMNFLKRNIKIARHHKESYGYRKQRDSLPDSPRDRYAGGLPRPLVTHQRSQRRAGK